MIGDNQAFTSGPFVIRLGVPKPRAGNFFQSIFTGLLNVQKSKNDPKLLWYTKVVVSRLYRKYNAS